MFTIAFSPCPNDTFIFDALIHKKIDTEGLEFTAILEDVQTLNQWALQGKHHFSKVSYGVLPLILENYKVLNSGSALGKAVGPLLITQNPNIQINNTTQIIIPGENTTAHLLFSLAYPQCTNKIFLPFNKIEDYVHHNPNCCGVIIHENRFTYQQKGLHKIVDLGSYWELTTQLPIPLGGIVAHKSIDAVVAQKVDALINKSLQYAFANYPTISAYVQQHAQEMDVAVMRQHINLYVNNFSLQLGNDGKNAIVKLLEIYSQHNNSFKGQVGDVFIEG